MNKSSRTNKKKSLLFQLVPIIYWQVLFFFKYWDRTDSPITDDDDDNHSNEEDQASSRRANDER